MHCLFCFLSSVDSEKMLTHTYCLSINQRWKQHRGGGVVEWGGMGATVTLLPFQSLQLWTRQSLLPLRHLRPFCHPGEWGLNTATRDEAPPTAARRGHHTHRSQSTSWHTHLSQGEYQAHFLKLVSIIKASSVLGIVTLSLLVLHNMSLQVLYLKENTHHHR